MKDMGPIIDEIQSESNARDRHDIRGVEIDWSRVASCSRNHVHRWDSFEDVDRKPTWTCATAEDEMRRAGELRCGERIPFSSLDPAPWPALPAPLPERLAIDDLLDLAAKAKSIRGPHNGLVVRSWPAGNGPVVELADDEAYQLGEGCELLASALDEERKQRSAEQAARAQVTRETADEIARLCSLVDELRFELRARKAREADLELRIAAANDQAESDHADLLAAEHARSEAKRALHELQEQVVGAMTDLPSVPANAPSMRSVGTSGAYDLPDVELAWFVDQAREEQRANAVVHPLAALADRVERVNARSEPAIRNGRQVCIVPEGDLADLLAAVARTPT